MKAEIDSYVLRLARSVGRDNNRQGSIQDAAIGDKLCLILKIHHRGRSIFQGTRQAQSLSNLFLQGFGSRPQNVRPSHHSFVL